MDFKCKHLRNEKTIFFQWQTDGLPLNFPNIFSLVLFAIGRNETKHCGKFKDFFIDASLWTTALGVEWSIFHVGVSFAIKNRPTHAEGCVQSNKYCRNVSFQFASFSLLYYSFNAMWFTISPVFVSLDLFVEALCTNGLRVWPRFRVFIEILRAFGWLFIRIKSVLMSLIVCLIKSIPTHSRPFSCLAGILLHFLFTTSKQNWIKKLFQPRETFFSRRA